MIKKDKENKEIIAKQFGNKRTEGKEREFQNTLVNNDRKTHKRE